jgi:hypothetical protein
MVLSHLWIRGLRHDAPRRRVRSCNCS